MTDTQFDTQATTTNYETLLPRLSAYENELAKDNYSFHDGVGAYLDQSQWQDRFFQLLRVARNSTLKNDPRPAYHQVVKSIVAEIDCCLLDMNDSIEETIKNVICSVDLFNADGINIPFFEEQLQGWAEKTTMEKSCSVMVSCLDLYHKAYPESLVQSTPLGTLVESTIDNIIDNKEINTLCQDTVTNLICTIEQIYCFGMEIKNRGEELFLYKNDIDWQSLILERMKIDDVEWLFRNYEDANLLEDWYENPYGNSLCFHPTFIINVIFGQVAQAFGVNLTEYATELSSWYLSLDLVQGRELDTEDYAENFKLWHSDFGNLLS